MLNLQVVYSLGEMPALTFSQMRCFTAWLVPQAAPVYTARTVADFQLKLLKEGRTPPTIEGYRAAIADSYPDVGLSHEPSNTRLIKSFHRDRPRATRHLPAWDLGIVMQFLLGPPYEPLIMASHKHITLKAVFVLALASGSRRSEIHSWFTEGMKFAHKYEKVHLASSPEFIAKNQRPNLGPEMFKPVVVPALSPHVGDLPDQAFVRSEH